MFEGKDVTVLLSQAGSGKTRRLVEEASKELEVRRPEEIALVTFTRKGAEEGLTRLCAKLMLEPADLPYVRTLHSLTFHALNLKAKQMFSKMDERKFNKEYGYFINRSVSGKGNVLPSKDSQYLDFYDLERSGALTSKQLAKSDIEIGYYRSLVRNYENYKRKLCLVDFFDCLIKYVQEGDSLPVKVVLIDEAQDITALQWKVIETAFCKAEKIIIAGDENQSIYSYSGARPDFLISFAKQFKVEHLSVSYRIPKNVYQLAKGITAFIGDKTDKPFNPREANDEGAIVRLHEIDRLRNFIKEPTENKPVTSWYILSRNNCFLTQANKMLEEAVLPYWTADGFFISSVSMTRLKDYYGFSMVGYKNEAKREMFRARFGITNFDKPFTDTNLFNEDRKWVFLAYVEKYGLKKLQEMSKWTPQILVSTVHHVKGGEADNVAFMLDNTRRTKGNVFEDIDEELRILYVAVTRTKQNLFLIDSKSGSGYDNIINVISDENKLGL